MQGSAMSVGSIAVKFQYVLYVVGYLSKFAFQFMIIVASLFIVVSSVGHACNTLIHDTPLPILNFISQFFHNPFNALKVLITLLFSYPAY